MTRIRMACWGLVAGCVLMAALPLSSHAAGDLELSLVVGNEARYVAPDGRKILITRQPTSFTVQIRNNADVSKQVWTDRISGALSKLRFELTDEQGKRTVVAKKKVYGQGEVWASNYLSPGQTIASEIVITPEEWDHVERVPAGEVRRFTVRALYQSDAQTLTSEPYEVTIAPDAPPTVMAPPPPAAPEAAPPITVVH